MPLAGIPFRSRQQPLGFERPGERCRARGNGRRRLIVEYRVDVIVELAAVVRGQLHTRTVRRDQEDIEIAVGGVV